MAHYFVEAHWLTITDLDFNQTNFPKSNLIIYKSLKMFTSPTMILATLIIRQL